ncbi:unnamed protein product [Parnassius mnemosyne]|uniref:Uncharacterized protein n=1 Tax=Parnassius mnemosyne TaxID=213953 RepID=A0AAV1L965_9NEOP
MDEEDAIKYDSAITSVQKDEKELAQLLKENILITTTSFNTFNKTISKIKYNEEILNNALNTILNNTNKITNDLLIESKVHSVFSSLEASLLALSFQLEDITNSIVLSSQNILHPSVLSPTQLYKELIDNDRHLPRDTGIPIALSINNIHLILSISDVSCYFINNKIVLSYQSLLQ